ncbi:hypothetical protein M9Y10_032583 [Tritrichomonas musculus]|uniref:Uncharacterized protein n=1 Tax=Tritrichomonas musculus TaxID=1915356 RepID=A0ABR2GYZ0_9EUKA
MILVSGFNKYHQLIGDINIDKNHITNSQIINIGANIKSFSIFSHHAVKIDENGQAYGIGKDIKFALGTPERKVYEKFTKITFDEINEKFISAYCGFKYTIYVTESFKFILCHELDDEMKPRIFQLTTLPVSIFGGYNLCSIIDIEGNIYVIKPSSIIESIKNNNSSSDYLHLFPIHLPSPAIKAALSLNSVFILTKYGDIYIIDDELKCRQIYIQLKNKNAKIVTISGTCVTLFAIDSDGFIYTYSQDHKFHIVGTQNEKMTERFVLIETFQNQKIKEAFNGVDHSLFITEKGEVFSCGFNVFKQLLISDFNEILTKVPLKVNLDRKYTPYFAIAGRSISVVFLNFKPMNCPNQEYSLINISCNKFVSNKISTIPKNFNYTSTKNTNEGNQSSIKHVQSNAYNDTALQKYAKESKASSDIMSPKDVKFISTKKSDEPKTHSATSSPTTHNSYIEKYTKESKTPSTLIPSKKLIQPQPQQRNLMNQFHLQ